MNVVASGLQTHVRCGGFVFIVVGDLPKEYKGHVYVITGPDCFKNQMWNYCDVGCISNVFGLICSLIKMKALMFNKPSLSLTSFFLRLLQFSSGQI